MERFKDWDINIDNLNEFLVLNRTHSILQSRIWHSIITQAVGQKFKNSPRML